MPRPFGRMAQAARGSRRRAIEIDERAKGAVLSMYALDGDVAVITGAARGIGRAAAERLLKEGARAALCDLDQEAGAAAVEALSPNYPGKLTVNVTAQAEEAGARSDSLPPGEINILVDPIPYMKE